MNEPYTNLREAGEAAAKLHAGVPDPLASIALRIFLTIERERIVSGDSFPIPMVLHCRACGLQHIDAEEWATFECRHRSHLCQYCGCIWRPADVATVGVAKIETAGKSDTWAGTAEISEHARDTLNDIRLLRDELSKGVTAHGVVIFREGMFSRVSRLCDWIAQGIKGLKK